MPYAEFQGVRQADASARLLQELSRRARQVWRPSHPLPVRRPCPCKPCSPSRRGTYLTDLTFIEDGNPDTIDGQINFKKRELIFKVIQEVQLYQSQPYTYPVVEPIATFLADLPNLGEKDLHELSLLLEPRDAELSQILQ